MLPQMYECFDCLLLEELILFRFLATHRLNHRFIDADWRDHVAFEWGVLAEYESEVNVEHLALLINHQILKMSVSNRH